MKTEAQKKERSIDVVFRRRDNIDLLDYSGDRQDATMTQGAITRELERCIHTDNIMQEEGDSREYPMSQHAVTSALRRLLNGLGCIYVSYDELVRMRNEKTLVPGRRYRITDYETVCDSHGDYIGSSSGITCHSAGHRFDIILTAETSGSLNENVSAIHHDGDRYFSGSRLSAWVVKYCLDNDTARFKWASRSGKGVIYHMKDEYGNECHYDFKNIMFRYASSYGQSNVRSGTMYYTYSANNGGGIQDHSLSGYCYNNKMDACRDYNGVEVLPANVYVNTDSFADCHDNKIGHDSYYNTFGNSCKGNILGYGCYYNHFPNYYQDNTIGNNSCDNVFNADYIYGNVTGNGFSRNVVDGIIMDTIMGNNCSDNKILSSLINSKIGNNCSCNIYKNANGVIYEDNCCYNICMASIPEGFDFYNPAPINIIDCENIIMSGNNYLNVILCPEGYVRNIRIGRNVQGTWEGYNKIEVPYIEGNHELIISVDSEGNTKIYCEADLVQLQ